MRSDLALDACFPSAKVVSPITEKAFQPIVCSERRERVVEVTPDSTSLQCYILSNHMALAWGAHTLKWEMENDDGVSKEQLLLVPNTRPSPN